MPEMDGLAAARAIRALPPPNNAPHIIALTAMTEQADLKHCREAGMEDYLAKPVTRDALAHALRKVLAKPAAATPPNVPPAADRRPADAGGFDQAIYAELADALGADGVRGVLEIFLSDTARRFAVMRDAAKAGDNAAVRREVHSLKSSAANFGFLRLSALAQALERDALGLNWPVMLARLDEVAREFAAVEARAAGPIAAAAHIDPLVRPEAGEAHAG